MRLWERAVLPTTCGACGQLVQPGDPVLVLVIVGLAHKRYRCPEHADEPVDQAQLDRCDAREAIPSPSLVTEPHAADPTDDPKETSWRPQARHLNPGVAQIDETDAKMRQAWYDDD